MRLLASGSFSFIRFVSYDCWRRIFLPLCHFPELVSNYENSLLLGEELVFISKLIMRASLDSLSKDLTILDVFHKI